jgi:4-amino-4-deoxy-L-arabinose transferase-like glycosyltransferase
MDNILAIPPSGEELFHQTLAAKPLSEIVAAFINNSTPPLYYLIQNRTFLLFGDGIVVMRGLSIFFTILTLLFLFLLASNVWSKKTALYAIMLTVFNPFVFYWSFKAGPYTTVAFAVVTATYFFSKRKLIPFLLFALAGAYIHPITLTVLPVYFIWVMQDFLFGERKTAVKLLKGLLLLLILLLPLFVLIKNPSALFLSQHSKAFNDPAALYQTLITGYHQKLTYPAIIVVFILLLVRDWTQKLKRSIFFLLLFLLPPMLVWATLSQAGGVALPLLLFCIPFAMLILATGKRAPASNIIIAVLIVLYAIINYQTITGPTENRGIAGNSSVFGNVGTTDIEE